MSREEIERDIHELELAGKVFREDLHLYVAQLAEAVQKYSGEIYNGSASDFSSEFGEVEDLVKKINDHLDDMSSLELEVEDMKKSVK